MGPPIYSIVTGQQPTKLLELGKAIIDQVDLYLPMAEGPQAWQHMAAGTSQPRPARQLQFRTPAFLLPQEMDLERPMYLRLKSSISLSMPLRLWTRRSFSRATPSATAWPLVPSSASWWP